MTRIILAILFVGISNSLYGQDSRQQVDQLLDSARLLWYVDFEKADRLLTQAETLASKDSIGDPSSLFQIYELRIGSCIAFSRLQLWRKYLGKIDSLLVVNKVELGEDFQLRKVQNDLQRAQYYFAINDDARSLQLFTQVLSNYKKLPESAEVCDNIRIVCNEIASIHTRRGEFEASINQYLASLPYLKCVDRYRGESRNNSVTFRNIGQVFLDKGDYLEAGRYLKLADKAIQKPLQQSPLSYSRAALSLNESLAKYYVQINKNDSALWAMRKSIPLLKLPSIDNEFKGRVSQTLGGLYFLESKFQEAKKYYDQAETFFLATQNRQAFFLSDLYLRKAELYEGQGDVKQALEYCGKAIEKLTLNFNPNADGNPVLQNVFSNRQLFGVLQKKSRLEEKLSANDVGLLIRAQNTNQLSLSLLDSTTNEFSLDRDKIILSEQSYSAYEDGIRISNKLYEITSEEKYFSNVVSLIEKSKGNLLLENLRLVNRFSGIKQEWLEREKELKAEMLLTEQALYKAGGTEKSNDIQRTRERYATIKRDYSTLIEQIKREAPDYYKLRFDHSVVSAETIQKQLLNPNEALIEFFVGDSILAIAGFTSGKKYLKVKPILSDFTEKMNQFRTVLTTGDSGFFKYSKEFYEFLIKDCLADLGPGIKSLTIIPDGLLGYLPFEVLIQSSDPKVVFLNENFAIHYANSATYLLEQMQRKTSESKNFFAGFVASGSGRSNNQVAARDQKWAPLLGAEHEVASITELFNSEFIVFNPANKTDFLTRASDYKILHFAMHSSLNDENPMMSVMVFSEADSTENLLTAIELYSMKLNSELAVLSACNTGVGQLHRGEGIMSFSRAFAYAGVPSAVISLWKVPDIATSKIMVSFYSHLKKGESKDRALQLARQDFVRENPEMAHPYFWSGFILTGNNSPLNFPQSYYVWWIVVSLLVLAGLFASRKKIVPLFRKF
ncbi:MAG TPA: CHAT domain-containing protein [Cyclobacteriaceae bacterium]|nr:CHAT domain-containing protein [Cyclobacteriaceae bacterium]